MQANNNDALDRTEFIWVLENINSRGVKRVIGVIKKHYEEK